LATVAADPAGSAEQACGRLAESGSGFLVHFDVDVVDFVDLALADHPQINRGLTLAQAMTALQVIVSYPSCRGLVVTEVNPDHGDLHGEDLSRLIDGLVGALSAPAR
jgi:arginase